VREYFLDQDVEEDILLQPDVQLNEVVILEEVVSIVEPMDWEV